MMKPVTAIKEAREAIKTEYHNVNVRYLYHIEAINRIESMSDKEYYSDEAFYSALLADENELAGNCAIDLKQLEIAYWSIKDALQEMEIALNALREYGLYEYYKDDYIEREDTNPKPLEYDSVTDEEIFDFINTCDDVIKLEY